MAMGRKLTEADRAQMKFIQGYVTPEAHQVAKMASVLYRIRMEEVLDAALRLYAREFQLDKGLSTMVLKAMYPGAEEKVTFGHKR